jgi:hypothetical protein
MYDGHEDKAYGREYYYYSGNNNSKKW